jgi:hypothetical protein
MSSLICFFKYLQSRLLNQLSLEVAVLQRALLGGLCLFFVSTSYAQALPEDIELDRLMLATETAIETQQWQRANVRLISINALTIDPPPRYYFYRGKVSMAMAQYSEAQDAIERYLKEAGREGEFYRQGLAILNRIEDKQTAERDNVERNRRVDLSQLSLQDQDHQDYLTKISDLYLLEEPRQALQLHINTLLTNHRYIPGKYRRSSEWLGSLYQVKVVKGQVILVAKRADTGQSYQISQDVLSIYGVNPYISSNCDSLSQQCWLNHPETGKLWLELEPNLQAAKDIAEAFSHLIRVMQQS